MSEEIRGNDQETFWASYKISPELIAKGDMDRWLEHAWREVDDTAARGIFEKINDGRLYCLRVERFERNFEFADALLQQGDPRYAGWPECSIGYKGTLSLVHSVPYYVPSAPEPSPVWAYCPSTPSWTEIRDGIRARLKADFKPNDKDDETWEAFVKSKLVLLRRWFIKNVLARVFYLPDTNPEFWGVDDF